MKAKDLLWPVIGVAAVGLSVVLLVDELRGLSLDDVWDGLTAIPVHGWILSALSALIAYVALAGYDHIALSHLNRRISFLFVALCSFTTYALAHNIGSSIISGAVIRYRAYGSRGLSIQEVGVLVAMCSLTFFVATVLVSSAVLILRPGLLDRYVAIQAPALSYTLGALGLLVLAAYVFGSWLQLRPLKLGKMRLHYPALPIVLRQFIVGPAELIAAAAIVYFALPEAGNPGFVTVLGIFVVSFSIALISHAPGGLGVLEVVFLTGLPDMDKAGVLAALLVFRLFYLIVPLVLGLFVVLIFEKGEFRRSRDAPDDPGGPS